MNKKFLITLVADPAMEEVLVDWLLSSGMSHGFTTSHIYGHSSQHQNLSLAEQVTGRKRQLRFQMCLEESKLTSVLEQLQTDFKGSNIHYWILPVADEGWI